MKALLTTFAMVWLTPLLFASAPQGNTVSSSVEFAGITFQLDRSAQKQIQEKVTSLTRSTKYYQEFLDRANLYFPLVDQILTEEGVPTDFKYVAMQESTLKGWLVHPRSGAAGYWQFIPQTANGLGMVVSKQLDERSDIMISTRKAAQNFRQSYQALGSWYTALIAHNTGLGGATRKFGTQYQGKRTIKLSGNAPHYVFMVLANKIAFHDALAANPPQQLLKVTVASGTRLSKIAQKTQVDLATLRQHNSWLKQDVLPKNRQQYTVLVPVAQSQAAQVAQALQLPYQASKTPASPPASFTTKSYKVESDATNGATSTAKYPLITKRKRVTIDGYSLELVSANGIPAFVAQEGESPKRVAKLLGMSAKKLMRLNDLPLFSGLTAGQIYYIKPKHKKAKQKTHIVQHEETLWQIAHQYGVQIDALRDKNRLGKKEEPQTGRVLLLRKRLGKNDQPEYKTVAPLQRKSTTTQESAPEITFVPEDIPRHSENNMPIISSPKKNQHKSHKVENSTPPAETETVVVEPISTKPKRVVTTPLQIHVVKEGETLLTIAHKYGVTPKQLKEWNPLDNYLNIAPGTELAIGGSKPTTITNTAPTSDGTETTSYRTQERSSVTTPNDAAPTAIYHTVSKGDTLYSIARRYNVTTEEIKQKNGKRSNVLSIGERLRIE